VHSAPEPAAASRLDGHEHAGRLEEEAVAPHAAARAAEPRTRSPAGVSRAVGTRGRATARNPSSNPRPQRGHAGSLTRASWVWLGQVKGVRTAEAANAEPAPTDGNHDSAPCHVAPPRTSRTEPAGSDAGGRQRELAGACGVRTDVTESLSLFGSGTHFLGTITQQSGIASIGQTNGSADRLNTISTVECWLDFPLSVRRSDRGLRAPALAPTDEGLCAPAMDGLARASSAAITSARFLLNGVALDPEA
jgi:hypothetical protein